jgi:hypothetical protein
VDLVFGGIAHFYISLQQKNMKKLSILITLLLFLSFQSAVAQEYAQKIEVYLQIGFDDPTSIGFPYNRMPSKSIEVTIFGTSLNLDKHLSPSLFTIIDDRSGEILYSQYVVAGTQTINIPQLPGGIYILKFKKEDSYYWGILNV